MHISRYLMSWLVAAMVHDLICSLKGVCSML